MEGIGVHIASKLLTVKILVKRWFTCHSCGQPESELVQLGVGGGGTCSSDLPSRLATKIILLCSVSQEIRGQQRCAFSRCGMVRVARLGVIQVIVR
eukprot:5258022-Amphidinium_carterae.1